MPLSLPLYLAKRQALQARLAEELPRDERFVASWFAGSIGRGEADAISDLDLVVVVRDADAALLCARPRPISSETTTERLELVSRFGQPAVIHENNNNVPEGSSFTSVLYAGTALLVDWALVPCLRARRPLDSQLIFDRASIPVVALVPSEPADRAEAVAERIAFFWIMAAVTIKHIVRRDEVTVQGFLDMLARTLDEAQQLVAGQVPRPRRGSLLALQPNQAGQVEAVRQLVGKMEALLPEVARLGCSLSAAPIAEIELLLSLAQRGNGGC